MKHYVILCDWAMDNIDAGGVEITAVAHSIEEAKEIFAQKVTDEKKYADDNGWKIYIDTDDEFDAGEDGFYASEHTHFYIQVVE